MPTFSRTSRRKLNTCHRDIQTLCNNAINYIDFTVVTGHRTEEEQNALYPKYTKLKWPHGKHNKFPSMAIDVAPYIPKYGTIFGNKDEIEKMMQLNNVSKQQAEDFVLKIYSRLIGVFEGIAYTKGIDIRLGLDWDGDFDMLDQHFHDLGHMELL